jgi:outer membrane protein assembly factor BamB
MFGLSAAYLPAADSWPQWRGPQRTAMIDGVGSLPQHLVGEAGLQLAWEQEHGPSYSGPVISDGVLVTTETVDAAEERVTAYRAATGEVLWSVAWKGAMSVPFFAKSNGDWIRATPAIHDGNVYVAGMRDVLVCLDLKTGNELWRCDFCERFKTELPAFGFACSPLVDEGAVYVQAGEGLCKLNAETGETIWRVLEGQSGMNSAFSSPVIATIAGQRQLVVQTREELCGVDLDSGNVYWRKPIGAFRGMNILTPTVVGDTIFTSAYGGRANMWRVTRNTDSASGIDTWGVEQIWDEKHQAYMSSPVVIDGHLYIHLKNKRFACIDLNDGKERWVTPPQEDYWSMVAEGNRILALSSDGVLRLIDASPDAYRELEVFKVADDSSWAHIAVAENRLFVRHLRGLKTYTFVSNQASPQAPALPNSTTE